MPSPATHSAAVRCVMLLVLVLSSIVLAACHTPFTDEDIRGLIQRGEFTRADAAIAVRLALDTSLTPTARQALAFERERLVRIRLDFRGNEQEVRNFILRWIPSAQDADLRRWEESGALEMMIIDGKKCYFNSAARNLFRIDSAARAIWQEKHQQEPPAMGLASDSGLDAHCAAIMAAVRTTGRRSVLPHRIEITYTIRVNPGAVPAGEVVRCWLPFPREIPGRQESVTLLGTDPQVSILADTSRLQRTVYLERPAVADSATVFTVRYAYTSFGVYQPIDPARVGRVAPGADLEPFLREEPPHIRFTPALRALNAEIVGQETNPVLIARKLFAWCDRHIPWASAREYSTIPSLSAYAFENRHGDCGIQTTFFITLLRMNGIPARWQSGWEFRPPTDSMHDWGMVYFAPYGWVPMDVTYGPRRSDDPSLRFFYLSGMDGYRLIFNDATGEPFYPAKVHPRSELLDSQRGEVEWRGGNLYFDQWDYEFRYQIADI